MDGYLQSCCGDHPHFRLPDSLDLRTLLATLTGGLVWALLVSWLVRARGGRSSRPDQCRSLDCTRCHGAAEAAGRAAHRLDTAAVTGTVPPRLRSAVNAWLDPAGGGRLLVAGLSDRVWWDGAHREDTRRLEAAWVDIAADYRWACGQTDGWSVNTSPAGRWRVFWLVNQGVRRVGPGVCDRTQAVVASLAGAMHGTVFSNVCFSVLEPGTRIKPHLGPTNVRVRCHLGLEVPDGCRLVADGQARQWSRRQCVVFDDSYLHHAEHGGPAGAPPRAVLMVDMWHPGLSPAERTLLANLLRPPRPAD